MAGELMRNKLFKDIYELEVFIAMIRDTMAYWPVVNHIQMARIFITSNKKLMEWLDGDFSRVNEDEESHIRWYILVETTLNYVFPNHLCKSFINNPHEKLNGKTPLELMLTGRVEDKKRVYILLENKRFT